MKYPGICSFQIKKDEATGRQTVFATELKGTYKLENKKFSDAKSYFWDGSKSAVIEIALVNNEDELKTKLYDLSQVWGTEES